MLLGVTASHAEAPPALTEDISAQPLPEALGAYARQTGLQLIYVSEIARGRTSNGVPAGLTAEAALTRLLEGTGLRFEFLNARGVRILAAAAAPRRPPVGAHAPRHGHDAAAPPTTLEEVLVTATAREEAASRVPISMSVWTQASMESSGVKGLADLATLTPGVFSYFLTGQGSWSKGLFIRGVGGTVSTAMVGLYLDDTPFHSRSAALDVFGNILPVTFDLERIEILLGPQGTLGGESTMGGAIRFITNQPSLTDWSGLARSEVTTTAKGGMSYEAGVAGGGPIVPDEMGFRVSAWSRWDAGYVDRVDPFNGVTVDAAANRTRTNSLRAALTFAPAAGVRVTPSLTYLSASTHDTPIFYLYLSDPSAGVLRNGRLLRQPIEDTFYLGSVKITAELKGADLSAVTAYTRRSGFTVADTTSGFGPWGNPLGPAYPVSYANAVPTTLGLLQTTLSQEVRLASSDREALVSWLVGTRFARTTEDGTTTTVAVDPSNQFADGETRDFASVTQQDGFAQLNLRMSTPLTASLGARVALNRYRTVQYTTGPANLGVPSPYVGRATEKPVTPRLGLSYAPDGFGVVYLTVAKGYRLGGVNVPSAPTSCAFPPTYAPDTIWSYELGAKEQLFGGRAQLDGSVFHLVLRDIQNTVHFSCGQSALTVNAGTAASNGFDLSVRAAVTDRVRLGAALEYADARYTATTRFADGYIVRDGDVLARAPRVPAPWSANTWLEVDVLRAAKLTASVRAENAVHSHNPGPFWSDDPTGVQYMPGLRADPATDLLNVRVRLTWADYELTGFVDNLLNSLPVLGRAADSRASTLYYATTFPPRTIGLTGTVRF